MQRKTLLTWLPNSITMGNLTFGFLSLIYASDVNLPNHLLIAGLMIILAAIFDGFDGQIARALKVASPMGKQLDSLADLITFGAAPGMLGYQMFLKDLSIASGDRSFPIGMVLSSIFPICTAYRLARFNIQSTEKYFQGLPSPVAGIVIALQPIMFAHDKIPKSFGITFFFISAFLMVSTIRYSKPQAVLMERLRGFKLIISLVIILSSIVIFREWAVVVIIGLYLISGFINLIIQFIQFMRL